MERPQCRAACFPVGLQFHKFSRSLCRSAFASRISHRPQPRDRKAGRRRIRLKYGNPVPIDGVAVDSLSANLFVTVVITLITKPKPEDELKGLVYGLTELSSDGAFRYSSDPRRGRQPS